MNTYTIPTITAEIERTPELKAFLAKSFAVPAPQPISKSRGFAPAQVMHRPLVRISDIEARALAGEFDAAVSNKTDRRLRLRRETTRDILVRGRSRESIDNNRRNGGRQRADVLFSRAVRQMNANCASCDTEWNDEQEASACCPVLDEQAVVEQNLSTLLEAVGDDLYRSHRADAGSNSAICGYVEIAPDPDSLFAKRDLSTYPCEACTLVQKAYEGKAIAELSARWTNNGQIYSDWMGHEVDDKANSLISLCGYVPQDQKPTSDATFRRPLVSFTTSCRECNVLAKRRKEEARLKNPSWVAEQMQSLQRQQEWHVKSGSTSRTTTVRELIALLSEQDPDAPVLTHKGT